MPGISFTQEEIAAMGQIEAGWYPVEIKSVVASPGTKVPTSTTWRIEMVVVGEGPGKGVPVTHFINNNSPNTLKLGRANAYLGCFVEKITTGVTYPIEDTAGKRIQAYLVYDAESNNNIAKDFKKL